MTKDEKTYGFNKDDAQSLVQSIGGGEGAYSDSPKRQQVVHRIFQTPSGGIAARSGVACGSAACTEYYVNAAGNIVVTGYSDVTVYNIFGTEIAGSVYITAKMVRGKLIADAEDCG